jgi:hypothetical protein
VLKLTDQDPQIIKVTRHQTFFDSGNSPVGCVRVCLHQWMTPPVAEVGILGWFEGWQEREKKLNVRSVVNGSHDSDSRVEFMAPD